jgi:hypothetical protein
MDVVTIPDIDQLHLSENCCRPRNLPPWNVTTLPKYIFRKSDISSVMRRIATLFYSRDKPNMSSVMRRIPTLFFISDECGDNTRHRPVAFI